MKIRCCCSSGQSPSGPCAGFCACLKSSEYIAKPDHHHERRHVPRRTLPGPEQPGRQAANGRFCTGLCPGPADSPPAAVNRSIDRSVTESAVVCVEVFVAITLQASALRVPFFGQATCSARVSSFNGAQTLVTPVSRSAGRRCNKSALTTRAKVRVSAAFLF